MCRSMSSRQVLFSSRPSTSSSSLPGRRLLTARNSDPNIFMERGKRSSLKRRHSNRASLQARKPKSSQIDLFRDLNGSLKPIASNTGVSTSSVNTRDDYIDTDPGCGGTWGDDSDGALQSVVIVRESSTLPIAPLASLSELRDLHLQSETTHSRVTFNDDIECVEIERLLEPEEARPYPDHVIIDGFDEGTTESNTDDGLSYEEEKISLKQALSENSITRENAELLGVPLPEEDLSISPERKASFIQKQIYAFFQPADTKLAHKLFGSRKAVLKERDRMKMVRGIIHPYSMFRFSWDIIMMCLLITNLLVLPVAISFFNDDLSVSWVIYNCIMDTMFIADIIFNFRTGVASHQIHEEIILEPKAIRTQYLKGWFIIDLLSSIPMDYIFLIVNEGVGGQQIYKASRALRIFRLAKLLSLMRLLRLSRLMRYAASWEEVFNMASAIVKIVNLICMMLLIAHWNGCLLFLVPMLQDFPDDCWVRMNHLEDKYWAEQYSWALFKAMSHMLCIGYGRFTPVSLTDVWMIFLSMLSGATCYALFIGYATNLIHHFDTSRRLYREKLQQVQEYIVYRKLPPRLRQRVLDYYEYKYQGKMFDEDNILYELSDALREEMINHNCRALVDAVPFFHNADKNFVNSILSKLQYEVYMPNDFIIREGTLGTKMYFIAQGIVDVICGDKLVTTLSDGSYFGEISLLARMKRAASIRAETYCNLYSLESDHFHVVLEEYPVMKEAMKTIAAERLKALGRRSSVLDVDRCGESSKLLHQMSRNCSSVPDSEVSSHSSSNSSNDSKV